VTLPSACKSSVAENRLNAGSVEIVSAPVNGVLVVNTDGTAAYTHDGLETTSDSFSYRVRDLDGGTSNTATVSVAVSPENDIPLAIDDSLSVDEGASINFSVIDNDSDSENRLDASSVSIAVPPLNGVVVVNGDGTIDYSHDGSETAADSFRYTIADQEGLVSVDALVSIAIIPRNDEPIALADSVVIAEGATVTIDLAANDSDAEGQLQLATIDISTPPVHGSVIVNGDGTVDYTHDGSETSVDSFQYTISDANGVMSADTDVNISISAVNDAPQAMPDSFSVAEGKTETLALTANDTDAEGGLDAASIRISTEPLHGTVSLNGNGTVDYTHDGSETATDSFTYLISDLHGNDSSSTAVTITIIPRNDVPVAVADNHSVTEGGVVTIDLVANDTDAENRLDPSTIVVTSPPAHATLDLHADGKVTYTHDGSESVADSFGYTVADRDGGVSFAAMVNIAVLSDNDAPMAAADAFSVDEGATVQLDVLQNDTDPDNGVDIASLRLVQGPAHGVDSVNSDGSITYQHDGSETTEDRLYYQVSDRAGSVSETAVVALLINPINDAPVVNRVPVAAVVDATADTVALHPDTFSDAEQEMLRVTATLTDGSALPPWLAFDAESLTFIIDSDKSEAGATEVLIVAEDAAGERATAVLQISIEPEIEAAMIRFDTAIEFPEPLTEKAERESEKPALVAAAPNDSNDSATPAASSDNRARESRDEDQSPTFSLDEDVPERELEIKPVEQHSKKQPTRFVQLEPVVENNPLRKLIELDKEQYEGFYRSVSDSIDNMQDDLNKQRNFQTGVLASSAVAASSLAVGYALWILRGGSLVFSLMASMPAWRFVDPFPVLGNQDDPDADSDTGGDAESLQSMVRQKPPDTASAVDDSADCTGNPTDKAAKPRDVR
jgi:VCBS repeat-containing protein